MDIVRHSWVSSTSWLTSHAVSLPADVQAGDLLVCIFSADSSGFSCTFSPSVGWTELFERGNGSTVFGCVFWKVATGDDALTVTASEAIMASAVVYRIRGADYVDGGNNTSSASNTPSPAFTPVSSGMVFLYITALHVDSTGVASAPPPMFENMTAVQHVSSSGASTSTADRITPEASQASSNWTIASTAAKVTTTLAIYLVPKLQGVVKDSAGIPASRQVSAHVRSTGVMPSLSGGRVASPVMSDPTDGRYEIQCADNNVEYFVVGLDDGNLPAVVVDRKIPT